MQPLPLEIAPRDVKQRLNAGERIQLIDVREPAEHAISRIAEADLIPMGGVPSQLQRLEAAADDNLLVVFCHHGVRSLNVVSWLRQRGVENCQSMAGGIERWSEDIDTSVPRY